MALGRVLYYGDFIAIPLVIAVLLSLGPAPLDPWSALTQLAFAMTGFVLWTLLEYLIHRFAYHNWLTLSKYHAEHHDRPVALVGFPSFVSVGLICLLVFLPLRPLDPNAATGLTCGVLAGYFVYVIVHHAAHQWTIQPSHILYRMRLRHLAHHRNETTNFGVSTGLWDVVFGTVVRNAKLNA